MGVRGLAALLVCSAVWAGEIERAIETLADPDPVLRQAAARMLTARGEEAQAALERALRHRDPEVRSAVRALLKRLGWIPLEYREFVRKIRGSDMRVRKSTVFQLAKQGGSGLEALRVAFKGPRCEFRVEFADELPSIPTEWSWLQVVLRNTSKDEAGWVAMPRGSFHVLGHKSFGRTVWFPTEGGMAIGLGGGAGGGRGGRGFVNTSDEFEWVRPGEITARRYQVSSYVSPDNAGLLRVRIDMTFPKQYVELGGRGRGGWILRPMKIPVECPAFARSEEMDMAAVPSKRSLGRSVLNTALTAVRKGDEVVLKLVGDGKSLAPRDWSSAWFAVLDSDNRLLAHGPVDGGNREPRRYRREELVEIPAGPRGLEARFSLPKQRRVGVIYGVRFSRAQSQHGRLLVSNRLLLPR